MIPLKKNAACLITLGNSSSLKVGLAIMLHTFIIPWLTAFLSSFPSIQMYIFPSLSFFALISVSFLSLNGVCSHYHSVLLWLSASLLLIVSLSPRVNLDPSKRQGSNKSVSGCTLPQGSKTVSKFLCLPLFACLLPLHVCLFLHMACLSACSLFCRTCVW